jgi:hypothetical protein
MQRFSKMFLLAVLASTTIASAEIASQSKAIDVLQPQDLPKAAQAAGQSMELHELGNGKTYLYIEQQQLGRLAILDVTDPAHIISVGTAALDLPESFDFATSLGDSAVLVYFRGKIGSAVLDLRDPRNPKLAQADALPEAADAEKIGGAALLMIGGPRASREETAQDYRIVDSSNPQSPKLLDTVKNVQKELQNGETGTTYLLNASGLTVIRQPRVELDHRLQSTYSN